MPETDKNWNNLYKIGGIGAWIFVGYSLVTMVLLIVIGAQPESAQEGFLMLQENRLIGLLRLDILTILIMPLYYLFFLSLYRALQASRFFLRPLLSFPG